MEPQHKRSALGVITGFFVVVVVAVAFFRWKATRETPRDAMEDKPISDRAVS